MRLELAGLAGASREALMTEWREVVGHPPPKHVSRPLLVQTLSHDYEHSPGLLKPNCRLAAIHTKTASCTRAPAWSWTSTAATPTINICTRSARDVRYIQTNSTPPQRNVGKSASNQRIAYTESEPRARARAST